MTAFDAFNEQGGKTDFTVFNLKITRHERLKQYCSVLIKNDWRITNIYKHILVLSGFSFFFLGCSW